MGHAPKSTTDLCTEHDVAPHLAADAALLQGYIGFETPKLEVVA